MVLRTAGLALIVACAAAASMPAAGHGFAGKRFFPATLSIEDSFVSPELDFLFSHAKLPGDDGGSDVRASGLSVEFAKPLTKNFQLSVEGAYLHLNPVGSHNENGFDNIGVGAKYQMFIDDKAESALAIGVDLDLGGTGSSSVDAESFSTIAPAVYYSKGFGNLSTGWLRPFAITTRIAPTFPTRSSESRTLQWGFTVQYSLPYLEDFVADLGLPAPFRNMIPIVEFPMETCLNHGCSNRTTGTIDPGLLWIGKYSQVGFELTFPINRASGAHAGFLLQYHLFLDDIIPSWSVR